jgi:hypothetical protein
VLAAVMPFEAPLFYVGPLLITTVELVLYTTLAVWGLCTALDFLRGRISLRTVVSALREDWAVQAAVLWCLVLFASALTAPSYRAAALKFALRSLSGVLVFFVARSVARPPQVARRVLLALAGGAMLSAGTAVIEWLVPSSAFAWRLFRERGFETLGLQRASGVFGYPTIGAMYWEATAPLLVVAPFLGARPQGKAGAGSGFGLPVLAGALLVGAILLSATRSGLVGAAVAYAALSLLVWRTETRVSRAARVALGVALAMSAFALVGSRFGSLLGERLQWWQDENWFHAEYALGTTPQLVRVGQRFEVPVGLRNTGKIVWRRAGDHPTHLSYHWERVDQYSSGVRPNSAPALGEYEGIRTDLPSDVPPGETCNVMAVVRGPAAPGAYRLRWDLVQEGVTWFGDQGNPLPEARVDATDADEPTPPPTSEVELPAAYPAPPSRFALWRAATVLWRERPLLGVGPDNFRRRYQAVLSPSPGAQPYTDTRLHANNMYFETLADLGLIGFSALVFIACALARLLRAHQQAGSIAGLGFGVSASTFFVHGTSDYFLEFTPLLCLFWLLLGLSAATRLGGSQSAL